MSIHFPHRERHRHVDEGSHDYDARHDEHTTRETGLDRDTVWAREHDEYGGIKWGSAFFGWLTAMGTAVLLTALLSAIGAGLGFGTGMGEAEARQNAETLGLAGGIALLVIMFVAYYAGGYVAGRMARFDGAKQGLAVWLWALIIAVIVAAVAFVAGTEFNVMAEIDGFPQIPISRDDLTTGGIIGAILAIAASIGGAVLGGLAGMRYHRKVDRAGLGR